jgi:hypothetical protein
MKARQQLIDEAREATIQKKLSSFGEPDEVARKKKKKKQAKVKLLSTTPTHRSATHSGLAACAANTAAVVATYAVVRQSCGHSWLCAALIVGWMW